MRSFIKIAAVTLFLPVAIQAQGGGQVVGPGGTSTLGNQNNWIPDRQAGAFAEVTSKNGRIGYGGYGSGSLELSVTGQRNSAGEYPDWGFFYLYSDNAEGFGSLNSLSRLSFDWYRSAVPNFDDASIAADWPFKTPVMRLVIEDQNDNLGELIWEGYFNPDALGNGPTPTNEWQTTSNMQEGKFWFNRPPREAGDNNIYVGTDCADENFEFWQGGIPGMTLNQLLGNDGCLANAGARIVGIAVGVGSQWPHAYHGYVDNVRMGFGDDDYAVDANFDFVPTSTVPEPSTYALMGAGLLALGVAARRRRKS